MEKQISKIGKICNGFELIKLKDILVKNDAGDWGNEPDEQSIGVIRSTNFTNEGILNLSNVAYRTLKPNKLKEKKLFVGEILIERSGGSDNQPVWRVGLITDEIAKDPFVFANFIQRIAINNELIPKYLFFCLQQMYEMGITASMQYQTTGIRNLDWKLYTKSFFPKPPKPEQTAIASILSAVDTAITATEKSITKAERLKKSLMQNLLTGKLKPDGTWRTEEEFYEDEKFGKVPKGWEVSRVKDFGFIQTWKTPPTAESDVFSENMSEENSFMFITPGDVGNSKYIEISERYVTMKGLKYSFKLPINSICIVCIGSTIGKIGINKIEACTNQQINTLIPNENNFWEFFFYMMSFRSQHFKEIAGINATPQINKSGYSKYKLLRPISKDEQMEIAKKFSSIDSQIQSKHSKIQILKRLKKSLMQQLLTGKKRVDSEQILSLFTL